MIEFANTTFKYNVTRADGADEDVAGVMDLNLKIRDGEFVVLTGGSGCGKTTVIRLINGLIPNFYNGELTGTVSLDGIDEKDMSIHEISKMVGSVFQNPRTQFFNVNTTDEMAFAAENQGVEPAKIEMAITAAAQSLDIGDLLNRNIFELSGGEKQIIACAGIDVLSPQIIVLDEPSSNLDHSAIKKLGRVLKEWKKAGKTIIIAEHRLFYLKDLADRMIVMDNGRIKKEFAGDELNRLTYEDCQKLGIRPLSLEDIPLKKAEAKEESEMMEMKNFSFAYKNSRNSVNIPSLSIEKGKVTAIIGYNGAGKSTLVRNICGLEKRYKGTFRYRGKAMNHKDRLHNCYMIMQDVNHQLFTESVIDEVMLSITDRNLSEGDKRKRADEILRKLDLSNVGETHPMALSGGQKQRTAIASGIASGKPIIIFDEPTSGLDFYHMEQVAGEIEKLREIGKTVLIVTHDYEFILKCCDNIVHMENGTVKDTYKLDENSCDKVRNFIHGEKGKELLNV
ncbi:MAG: energy-coupling factor ABC transporter ATP-binding protein [Lachnospiraceae bacterium]|nr:energy-coupling factor ABC transporter ATP-binding protein [Lachnospiraceae bacterium]